jgi:monofunctional biosynthetic peptidoglycan transglycosylase
VTSRKGAKKKPSRRTRKQAPAGPSLRRRLTGWILRGVLGVVAFIVLALVVLRFIGPPSTFYMSAEARRLGGVEQAWVPLDRISPEMPLAAVAAEDANFCSHWGFDMDAIRKAIEAGGKRGASTISQQTVKNVFLWQGRSWPRKALEAMLTPAAELFWPKRRILELYLNVAEFDEGVFGVEAAARRYFNVSAADLTAAQAARLAAVLPDPKDRSAARPTAFLKRRTSQIMDGAATLRSDGRAACFRG